MPFSAPAIEVSDLRKSYRLWANRRSRLLGLFSPGAAQFSDFEAVGGVSFEVPRGSALGIVGRNGSGKSTLLSMLAGVSKPTSGTLERRGRVTALLELGAGFQPHQSGRENALVYGMVMGVSRREMLARMDEIADFADIGPFFDQPIRTYSSGMFVRLAFASMLAAKPDILVIDEVLAVGDAPFQRKCLAHITSLRENGATIALVTHDLQALKMFCQDAIMMQRGKIIARGSPKDIADQYLREVLGKDDGEQESASVAPASRTMTGDWWSGAIFANLPSSLRREWPEGKLPAGIEGHGDRAIVVDRLAVLDANGEPMASEVRSGQRATIRMRLNCLKPVTGFQVGVLLRDKFGQDVWGRSWSSDDVGVTAEDLQPGESMTLDVAIKLSLRADAFHLTLGVQSDDMKTVYWYGVDVLTLTLAPSEPPIAGLVELQSAANLVREKS